MDWDTGTADSAAQPPWPYTLGESFRRLAARLWAGPALSLTTGGFGGPDPPGYLRLLGLGSWDPLPWYRQKNLIFFLDSSCAPETAPGKFCWTSEDSTTECLTGAHGVASTVDGRSQEFGTLS